MAGRSQAEGPGQLPCHERFQSLRRPARERHAGSETNCLPVLLRDTRLPRVARETRASAAASAVARAECRRMARLLPEFFDTPGRQSARACRPGGRGPRWPAPILPHSDDNKGSVAALSTGRLQSSRAVSPRKARTGKTERTAHSLAVRSRFRIAAPERCNSSRSTAPGACAPGVPGSGRLSRPACGSAPRPWPPRCPASRCSSSHRSPSGCRCPCRSSPCRRRARYSRRPPPACSRWW